MDANSAVTALAALAQGSRLALFRRLVELGPDGAVPGELSRSLGLAPATLSFHLKTLVQAGLIEAEPRGRFIHYRADFGRMRALVAYLTENCCGGHASQCAPAAPQCTRDTA